MKSKILDEALYEHEVVDRLDVLALSIDWFLLDHHYVLDRKELEKLIADASVNLKKARYMITGEAE